MTPSQQSFGRSRARRTGARSSISSDTAVGSEQSARVLHVDDDAGLVEMAATFLERADETFTVVTETAPRDALERLETERIDCIVSDYQMPRLNGLEFLHRVRDDEGDLPFILFTGQGSEEVASDAIAAGVTDYLQKETGSEQFTVLANRIRNVIEQHRAEQELDTLRSRYELVARASSDAFHDWDLESDTLWWSEGLQGTFGYSAAEIENDRTWWEERIHPDDRQRVLEAIHETFEREEELLEVAHRFRRADGTYAHILTRGYVVYEAGEPVRMAGALIDVTERKEREEAVRASERRFRALTESVTDGVITIDAESTITYANPALEELFGYSSDELQGASLTTLMPERLRDRHEEGIERYLRTGERRLDWTGVELPGQHKDGTEIPLAISFGDFEQNGQQFFTGVIRDVTEPTEREVALRDKNDRLDEFASIVSHDLKNPLTVAEGRLELARDDDDSEHLAVVAEALDRMEALVDDLLMLAREGELEDAVEPVPLAEVVETAKTAVANDAVAVAVESELGTITGHQSHVCGLVENLFRNAVEHGGSDVTIRVGPLDGGFYVEDEGPGIPADERDDVFEAGYTTKADGTGVGLNIVKKIVDAHGWDITVTDGTEGGARFEILGVTTAE